MERKILYINRKDADRLRKVRACAAVRRIRIMSAGEDELAGLPEDAELMKLCGLSGSELQEFLSALRREGIRVDYKCVETDVNRGWTLAQLYGELAKEHAAMHGANGG